MPAGEGARGRGKVEIRWAELQWEGQGDKGRVTG